MTLLINMRSAAIKHMRLAPTNRYQASLALMMETKHECEMPICASAIQTQNVSYAYFAWQRHDAAMIRNLVNMTELPLADMAVVRTSCNVKYAMSNEQQFSINAMR